MQVEVPQPHQHGESRGDACNPGHAATLGSTANWYRADHNSRKRQFPSAAASTTGMLTLLPALTAIHCCRMHSLAVVGTRSQ
jgi:hypothetical protein